MSNMMNANNYVASNQTITSAASLSEAINSSEYYNIQFLTPDYNPGSYASLPSQKDIIEVK